MPAAGRSTAPANLAGCGRCASCSAAGGCLRGRRRAARLGHLVARRVAVPPAGRAQGRRNAVIQRNEAPAAAPVDRRAGPGPRGRRARTSGAGSTATGTYDTADTVVVRYRTHDGASGVDVVVAAGTDDGSARCWSTAAGWPPTNTRRGHRRRPRAAGRDRSRSPAGCGRTPPVTAPRSADRLDPGDLQRARSADAPSTARCTAASSTCDRGAPQPRHAAASRGAAGARTTARTSSTGCSGGSSACWRCSASSTWCTTSGAGQRGERPRGGPRGAQAEAAAQPAATSGRLRARAERAQSERSMPPSTGTIAPVTNDAAGESRKAATRPNSSGSP